MLFISGSLAIYLASQMTSGCSGMPLKSFVGLSDLHIGKYLSVLVVRLYSAFLARESKWNS